MKSNGEQGDDELDEILWAVANHYDHETTDPYPQTTVPEAKTAILAWHEKGIAEAIRGEKGNSKRWRKRCEEAEKELMELQALKQRHT